jgi:hypothetical protein
MAQAFEIRLLLGASFQKRVPQLLGKSATKKGAGGRPLLQFVVAASRQFYDPN